ncbi:hypothetical protein CDIK_3190, partial [Cucumispora dikerogammari]
MDDVYKVITVYTTCVSVVKIGEGVPTSFSVHKTLIKKSKNLKKILYIFSLLHVIKNPLPNRNHTSKIIPKTKSTDIKLTINIILCVNLYFNFINNHIYIFSKKETSAII